jgi:hypothetical protein
MTHTPRRRSAREARPGHGPATGDRPRTETRAHHQQGRAHSVEVEHAFRAVYLLVMYGPPRSWG